MKELASAFEKSRRRLFGLAYRMLGSAADAEDIVQETWLRAAESKATDLRSPEAYFVTIASRLCLDALKSSRRKREVYVGPWLPEPIADIDGLSPESAMEYADDLSLAFLLALERLAPPERAAFLLHDIFDLPFSEIAETLGRTEASCRQLASRARHRVRGEKPVRRVSPSVHGALLTRFAEAIATGDATRLESLLAEDAIAWSDGGGVKRAALNPVHGADRVARFFIGLARKGAQRGLLPDMRPAMLNGAPSYLLYLGGALDMTMSIDTDGERITAVYLVSNPEKLRRLDGAGVAG